MLVKENEMDDAELRRLHETADNRDTQLRFTLLMIRPANMDEHKEWYDLHAGTFCRLCIENRKPQCLPQPPNYASCTFCSQHDTICSWRLDEMRYRVKKKMGINDYLFDLLQSNTKVIRNEYLANRVAAMTSSQDCSSSTPEASASHANAVVSSRAPLPAHTTSGSAAATNNSTSSPSIPAIKPAESRSQRKSSHPAPPSVDPHQGNRSNSREEVQRLRNLLAAVTARNAELQSTISVLHSSHQALESAYRNSQGVAQEYKNRAHQLGSQLQAIDNERARQTSDATANADLAAVMNDVEELKKTLSNVKLKKDALNKRVQDLESASSASLQQELTEHANIHVLIRFLSYTRDAFAQNTLSREQLLQNCDKLLEQLNKIAARRLERVPPGFTATAQTEGPGTNRRSWDEAFGSEALEGREEDGRPGSRSTSRHSRDRGDSSKA